LSNIAGLWDSYSEISIHVNVLLAGVKDFVPLDSSMDYLCKKFFLTIAMMIGLVILLMHIPATNIIGIVGWLLNLPGSPKLPLPV
jgi:hypothetical protein